MTLLADSERAELEALRDLHARLMFVDDDGSGVFGCWVDAHRRHKDEPYIGCPFCRDRFVGVAEIEALLTESSRYFAGDHVNADVAIGDVRRRLRALRSTP